MSVLRAAVVVRCAAHLALAAAACGPAARPRAGGGGDVDGLALALYADAEGREGGMALVEDRRVVEVAGDGTVWIDGVAGALDLSSLVIEALDGRPLAVARCALQDGPSERWQSQPMALWSAAGVAVTGRVLPRSLGRVVVESDDGTRHFLGGPLTQARLGGTAARGVACDVVGDSGARRVRLAYAARGPSWSASYRFELEATCPATARATLRPALQVAGVDEFGVRRAAVTLMYGLPGRDTVPREVWSGELALRPGPAWVWPAPRTVPVRLGTLYRGAVVVPDDDPGGAMWRQASSQDVWRTAVVEGDAVAVLEGLPAGPVSIEFRDGESTRRAVSTWSAARPAVGAAAALDVQVALWPEPTLVGWRERRVVVDDGKRLVEQYLFSVGNHGATPATVWVEEELRPLGGRRLRTVWPARSSVVDGVVRFEVEVRPSATARAGFEAEYAR